MKSRIPYNLSSDKVISDLSPHFGAQYSALIYAVNWTHHSREPRQEEKNSKNIIDHDSFLHSNRLKKKLTDFITTYQNNHQDKLVGAIGFEPTTPSAPLRCATKLRYAPTEIDPNNNPNIKKKIAIF